MVNNTLLSRAFWVVVSLGICLTRAQSAYTHVAGFLTTTPTNYHYTSLITMAPTNGGSGEKTYFEQQRELLVGDVAVSLENVLQNINKLNRSLEGVIAVRLETATHSSAVKLTYVGR